MRLAAIDVGTNSVHMVIADVSRDGNFTIVDRVRETVRLGRRAFETGRLSEEAMELAVRAMSNFARLLAMRNASRVRAVATSAVREASNGESFIRRIRSETGIKAEIISGEEEARLVFVAARHAMGLERGPHLLIDIGGGSMELILARDGEPLWARSLPLGISRVSEHFFHTDPPAAGEIERLVAHLHERLDDALTSAKREGVKRAIGTSGTVNSLVAIARAASGEEIGRTHGASASADELARVHKAVLARNYLERIELEGAEARRADLMPAAAILTDFVVQHSGVPELVACTWALREGLLLELAGLTSRRAVIDARRHSVAALAQKFEGGNAHGRTVAHLAAQLFDSTAAALRLPWSSRELLEHAALLHDIGHTIDHDRHNRHSYYLIRNADLFGFDPIEIEMIAQIARGHRIAPRLDASHMGAIDKERRQIVIGLAAILRVADALDRSHFGLIQNVRSSLTPRRLAITVEAGAEGAELEMWACERRTDLLAALLERRVILRIASPPRARSRGPRVRLGGGRRRRAP